MTRSPDRFLRTVLLADAASCLATAGAQLLGTGPLARWLGLPPALLVATGVFLAAYGLLVGWTARRPALPRALVVAFAVGNVGWAAGCALGVASGAVQPTVLGLWWIGAQAACVLLLADLQWVGLRRIARSPAPLATTA